MLATRNAMPLRWSRGAAARAFSSCGRLSPARASARPTSSGHHSLGGSAPTAEGLAANTAAKSTTRDVMTTFLRTDRPNRGAAPAGETTLVPPADAVNDFLLAAG